MTATGIIDRGGAVAQYGTTTPSPDTHDQPVGRPWLEEAIERDIREVRAYAAGFVRSIGPGGQTWENTAPLIRDGWAVRHDQVCVARHDWRLSWPAARE